MKSPVLWFIVGVFEALDAAVQVFTHQWVSAVIIILIASYFFMVGIKVYRRNQKKVPESLDTN